MPSLKEASDAYVARHEDREAPPDLGRVRARAARTRRMRVIGVGSVAVLASVVGLLAMRGTPTAEQTAREPGGEHSTGSPVAGADLSQHSLRDLSKLTRLRGHDVPLVLPHSGPCQGTQLTVPKAMSDLRVSAPVLVPDSPQASISNLSSLWRCDDGSYVAMFASGLEVVAQPGWDDVTDPTAWWAAYLSSNGYGRAEQVHGESGVVEDPDGDHRGIAQAIVHGWMIMVLGNSKLAGSQLNEVAATL